VLAKFGYTLLALLGINIIIGIHEAGHFAACKLFSIETPEFSIGFGPALYAYRIGETQFSLRMLPIGGYVQIAGMQEENSDFAERPYYQKALVTLSGILCNIILAMAIFHIISPREFSRRLRDEIGLRGGFIGPIGIISLLMQTAASGADMYWGFVGFLSANLAIFNALPIPFLDGGHFVSYTLHALNQSISVQEAQQALLLTALFFLLVYILYASMRRA